METKLEQMISLLFDKENEIKELQDCIIQLQTKLQAIQLEYAKLYKLHSLRKTNIRKVRKIIGFKRKES